jgi:(1->4)-alpha-D-glucan 1-alpha-D-glucosylmutase
VEGLAPPDRNDEYMLYQMLLGSWPVELLGSDDVDRQALDAYAERVKGALVKSMREAKVHSTWSAPDEAYEAAMLDLAGLALDPARSAVFLADFRAFAEDIASLGVRNTLAQTVLKLTAPGMPDLYQGGELWDLSLVDPDNRRPVDYAARARLLDEMEGRGVADLMPAWRDGGFKLAATTRLLALRDQAPALFAEGGYQPVAVTGPDADAVCAFVRQAGDLALLTVVTRFPARHSADGLDAHLDITEDWAQGDWRDILQTRAVTLGSSIELADLLAGVGVAVLFRGAGSERRRGL